MSIKSVNNQSFGGIKKVVSLVLPTKLKNPKSVSMSIQKGICKPLKADTFTPSKKAKSRYLIKMTQFFNGDKLVGTHYQLPNGSYSGNRVFADGTKISYNATNMGNDFFVAGTSVTVSKKGLKAHLTHDAYDKKGRPAIPTLKLLKELQNPKNYETRYEPCC